MNIISRATSYKVKCNKCASMIEFGLSEIKQDDYNYRDYIIKCPACKNNIMVASDHYFDGYSLSKNVTPIYEEGEETNG